MDGSTGNDAMLPAEVAAPHWSPAAALHDREAGLDALGQPSASPNSPAEVRQITPALPAIILAFPSALPLPSSLRNVRCTPTAAPVAGETMSVNIAGNRSAPRGQEP
jgi:hypothetical protein